MLEIAITSRKCSVNQTGVFEAQRTKTAETIGHQKSDG
jgi:hypothetical protein